MKNKNNFITFLKCNWAKIVLITFSLITIIIISIFFIPNLVRKLNFSNSVSNFEKKSSLFYLDKIYCYSSATGINNSEGKAMWDVNVSQYTDIALYLGINNVKNNLENNLEENLQVVDTSAKYSISKIYIDKINFSNTNTGNLNLNYIPILNFGLISDDELAISNEQQSKINFNIVDSTDSLLNDIVSEPSIDNHFILPITLRYLNQNIKNGHVINNIEDSLSFDGSILKRSSIPLSYIKNEVSFTIHIINELNEDYSYQVVLQVPLQNADANKTIYDGSYSEEINLNDCYFY